MACGGVSEPVLIRQTMSKRTNLSNAALQNVKTSPDRGGVVRGATRARMTCSYAYASSINLGSENGLPRISSAIGRPTVFTPAGRTIAGKPVTALMLLSLGPSSDHADHWRWQRFDRIHERIDLLSVHQVDEQLPYLTLAL